MPQATYEDANLVLRMYELRREDKLRKARDWFAREFSARSADELAEKYSAGSEENAFYRMVVSYWEMLASFLVHGIIHEELFFETCGEGLMVWEKVRPFISELRARRKNPLMLRNLEKAAARQIAWLNQHAPGAYETMLSMRAVPSPAAEKV
jgi:hypothetical protein